MESIKDKAAIIGMDCTQFGELWDMDAYDLVVEAVTEACQDAGVELKEIQAAWVGTIAGNQVSGATISSPLQLQYIGDQGGERLCLRH